MLYRTFLVAVLLVVITARSHGQDVSADSSGSQQEIYLFVYTADTSFYGRLVSIGLETVVLDREGKMLTLPMRSVTKILRVEKQEARLALPFANPNYHRYLFAPSAYMLKQGDGYYQNIYLFINQFTFGVTDWFSLSTGFDWLTLLSGQPAVLVSPKFGVRLYEKFGIGAGSYSVFLTSEEESMHIVYGVITYGSNEANLTVGAGRFFTPDDFWGNGMAYSINTMMRAEENIGIVIESWIFVPHGQETEWIVAPAVRFMSEKITWDLGLIFNPYLVKEAIPIPYADFVYHW